MFHEGDSINTHVWAVFFRHAETPYYLSILSRVLLHLCRTTITETVVSGLLGLAIDVCRDCISPQLPCDWFIGFFVSSVTDSSDYFGFTTPLGLFSLSGLLKWSREYE